MSKPNFFEDIEVGSVEEFGSYEVSAQEIIEFATQYDPQPFHLSEEGGKKTHFGGLVALPYGKSSSPENKTAF